MPNALSSPSYANFASPWSQPPARLDDWWWAERHYDNRYDTVTLLLSVRTRALAVFAGNWHFEKWRVEWLTHPELGGGCVVPFLDNSKILRIWTQNHWRPDYTVVRQRNSANWIFRWPAPPAASSVTSSQRQICLCFIQQCFSSVVSTLWTNSRTTNRPDKRMTIYIRQNIVASSDREIHDRNF